MRFDGAVVTRSTSPRQPGGPDAAARADGRTQYRHGQDKRQQILDAAVELFAARGFRGTGIAALAQKLGMTAPGILYYFGSKERLLAEVVAERDVIDFSTLPPDITLGDYRNIGDHNVETALLTRLFVVLRGESFEEGDPLHEFFSERQAVTLSFLCSVLERDRERGLVRGDVEIDQVAKEILATILGAEVLWLTSPGDFDLAEVLRSYVDRLVLQLAPR